MKKICCLLLGIVLMLSLVACGNSQEEKEKYIELTDTTLAATAEDYPFYVVSTEYNEEENIYYVAAGVNVDYIEEVIEGMDVNEDYKDLLLSITVSEHDSNIEEISTMLAILKAEAAGLTDETEIEVVVGYVDIDGNVTYY